MKGSWQHHLKRDMTAAAAVGQPQMNRAPAKASAQESLQGRPKFTGLAAISQGRSLGAAPLIRPAPVRSLLYHRLSSLPTGQEGVARTVDCAEPPGSPATC